MFTNIDRKSGHSDYPVEVRDQGFDGRERGFKPAIPAREQYENWAPPRMHELVGGKSFAVAVNDRFSLGRDIAHDYAHDHPGTTAKEEGLSDFSEAVLKFGDVCDGGLYLDKTDAGGWVYHREAAQFERGLTALRVMDCALNERRCGRWAGCSRHAENSGQHAFWASHSSIRLRTWASRKRLVTSGSEMEGTIRWNSVRRLVILRQILWQPVLRWPRMAWTN